MIYSNFISKTNKYLKSVRVLKNYVTFDMIFPGSWVLQQNDTPGVEVITNESDGNTVYSFVSEIKSDLINQIEKKIDIIIKTNIEREEKERLFQTKVDELKNIFDKENLENLKSLKFDLEELAKKISNETKQSTSKHKETA